VTNLAAARKRNGFLDLQQRQDFSLVNESDQTDSYIQQASYSTGNVGLFPEWYSGQGINLTTLLHLVRRFRMGGTILPHPSDVLMAYIKTPLLLLFQSKISSQYILTSINSKQGRKNPGHAECETETY
jgi:hypothetical protein